MNNHQDVGAGVGLLIQPVCEASLSDASSESTSSISVGLPELGAVHSSMLLRLIDVREADAETKEAFRLFAAKSFGVAIMMPVRDCPLCQTCSHARR